MPEQAPPTAAETFEVRTRERRAPPASATIGAPCGRDSERGGEQQQPAEHRTAIPFEMSNSRMPNPKQTSWRGSEPAKKEIGQMAYPAGSEAARRATRYSSAANLRYAAHQRDQRVARDLRRCRGGTAG